MIFITWHHQDQQLHGWHTMVWSTRSSMESLIGCIKVIMALLLDLCNWLKCDLFNLRVLLNDRIVCKISKHKMNWARMALYPSQCSSLNAMYKFKPVIINSCYYITRQLSSNLSILYPECNIPWHDQVLFLLSKALHKEGSGSTFLATITAAMLGDMISGHVTLGNISWNLSCNGVLKL